MSPEVLTQPAPFLALHDLVFLTGGPGHIVPFGPLPRWLAVAGLVLAVVAEASTLTLLGDAAAYLLPIARFGGLAWLIAAGVLLPPRRLPANA